MPKSFSPVVGVMILLACSATPQSGPEKTTQVASTTEISGKTAYAEYCAVCHETGMLGAPVVGDPSSWAGRSQLWQAVLMEHAKTGYLDMPAKGGRPDISDATATAAAEYMLETTFTDMPAD